ncbi:MAG: AtpZ/AtpI family protein [Eubacteriales bacterium]|nr:AtpZ/AtpI family protein [Eubacteriales bacterium]
MDKHQILKECIENLTLLTQLGLSIAIPPLVCLYAAGWLRNRLELGLWIMALALIFGLGGSVSNIWKFWKIIQKRGRKSGK